uniref:Spt5 KOW domain-containing protein n=1 Tax=Cannabis sativa TaxID=3483 RepID=A0A803Q9V5_CANSA
MTFGVIIRVESEALQGKQGPVEHIYKGVLFIYDRHHLEHAGFICAKSQSCVAVVKEIVPLVMAMKINGLVDIHFLFLMNNHSDHADIDLSFDIMA